MVPGEEESRQIAIQDRISPYNLMVKLLVSQGDIWNALRYAEMSKSRVLDDVLSGGRAEVTKSMTEEEKLTEKIMNRDLVDINIRIRNESLKPKHDSAVLETLRSEAQSSRLRYDSFMDVLYASHPELKIERGLPAPLTPNNLAALIGDTDTAFLEYLVTDEQLYLFVTSRNPSTREISTNVLSIDITRKALSTRVGEFHKIVAERNPVFADAAQDVFKLLIGPASNLITDKKRICIIPDDVLWDLPFQALQSKNDRYLIEDYVVYYAPSITALREMSRSKKWVDSPSTLLAFGNPMASKGSTDVITKNTIGGAEGLVDSAVEVKEIATTFASGSNNVLIGRDANESSFKSLSPLYSFIHIATHGIIDNAHPLYSYLLLAKTDDENDGYLEAREIMNLSLHADLVVLSACETARGKIGAGEGVIGLSWAFFIAGSRATIVSQWKVHSAATSVLMTKFYKNLKSENSPGRPEKAEALRKATLETMKDPRYRHPFYWAAFVMVGSDQ
jgi:CHAT domain-containing protein